MPTPMFTTPDVFRGRSFEYFHRNELSVKRLTPERRLQLLRVFAALLEQQPPRVVQTTFKEPASAVSYAVWVVQRELIKLCPSMSDKAKKCNTPLRLFHAPELWREPFDQHLRSEIA